MPDAKVYWAKVKGAAAELLGVRVEGADGETRGKEGGRLVSTEAFAKLLASAESVIGYSLKTPDGGKEGRLIQLNVFEAAQGVLGKRIRLATDAESQRYYEQQAVAQESAREESRRQQIRMTVLQSGDRLAVEGSPPESNPARPKR